MTETTWTKTAEDSARPAQGGRLKFLIGGAVVLAAVVYLIISGTAAGARYFITVNDLTTSDDYVGQTVRISGAVLGDSIRYDTENLIIDFDIVHIADDLGDLAAALHNAVSDPNAARLPVHVEGQVKPDLLQHEAQAILTGTLDENGVFHASELLLKCPSRYNEAAPNQAVDASGT